MNVCHAVLQLMGPLSSVVAFCACSSDNPDPGPGNPATDPNAAVAKFCNDLGRNGQALALTLRVGAAGSEVAMTASTGACAPAVPQPCQPLSTGTAVPLSLSEGTMGLSSGTIQIDPKMQVLFVATLDNAGLPAVRAFSIAPATQCSMLDPTIVPDAGAEGGGIEGGIATPQANRSESRAPNSWASSSRFSAGFAEPRAIHF